MTLVYYIVAMIVLAVVCVILFYGWEYLKYKVIPFLKKLVDRFLDRAFIDGPQDAKWFKKDKE